MKKLIISISAVALLASCTPNQRARNWGGTETIDLATGARLVNVTWKGNESPSLWVLTKQDTTAPTTYIFTEKSSYGILQGQILIVEN